MPAAAAFRRLNCGRDGRAPAALPGPARFNHAICTQSPSNFLRLAIPCSPGCAKKADSPEAHPHSRTRSQDSLLKGFMAHPGCGSAGTMNGLLRAQPEEARVHKKARNRRRNPFSRGPDCHARKKSCRWKAFCISTWCTGLMMERDCLIRG